jgi:hypothetical protein
VTAAPGDLLAWPKRRHVTTLGGRDEVFVIEPGRLVIWHDDDHVTVYADVDGLRALALALHAAVIERDLAAATGHARGRAQAHQRAILAGLPTGDPYRRYEDRRKVSR